VRRSDAGGLIVHDCAAMHGVSGAPLLRAITETTVEIVGLHVATGESMGQPAAFAVPVTSFAQQAASH
jgi:hypothetical protein